MDGDKSVKALETTQNISENIDTCDIKNHKLFLTGFFNTEHIVLIIWRPDGTVVWLNKYAGRLADINDSFVKGEIKVSTILPAEVEGLIREKAIGKENMARHYEYTGPLITKNTCKLYFKWDSYSIPDESGDEYIITTGVDITGFKFTEKKLQEANEELSVWQKEMAAMNEELMAQEEELKHHLTELKKQDEALKVTEERYRLVVEGASDGIWDWDLLKNSAYLSEDWSLMLGFEESEVLGYYDKWVDRIHPNDKKAVINNIKNCLNNKCSHYLYEYRIKLKTGKYIWVSSKGKVLFNENLVPIRIAGSHTNITERKKTESKLNYLAYYDILTGIPLRATFMNSLKDTIQISKAKGICFAVLFLDIDNFKIVNDTYGHHIGDRFLKKVADRLKSCIRKKDMLSRIGGDEFTLLLNNLTEKQEAELIANDILKIFEYPVEINGHKLYTTFSIGISVFPENGQDGKGLIKKADIAMYQAKENGKNNIKFYDYEMSRSINYRDDLKRSLRSALEKQEFYLCYQPLVEAKAKKVVSLEALIRWRKPGNGIISPNEFICLAEESKLIIPIGEWVLDTACRQIKEWHDAGIYNSSVSVNISVLQLKQPEFIKMVSEILLKTGLSPEYLQLEITESSYMEHIHSVEENMKLLKKIGIKVLLDDFGTGYNTLKNLQNFTVDSLKIDRSFVGNIKINVNKVIVEAIILLGRRIHAEIIAEGVETKEQYEYLKSIGCNIIQGYYFCKPLESEETVLFLKQDMKAVFVKL
ncbi:sensor domain-containing protein [Anaerocolumna sp. MB42-C2]|uniref:sensor domain-containing protein n=1 Tax=Anaerocolumna sp. MB42-C2 TaxID=3070997 RepID=UPI0027E04604|nr:EAL domain-containing protein [Anaerocolumna sp. MB42-C2]WMJ85607.1 EAL domain-containing protein [Anaerocolumna sp. MB42-C2]